MGGAGGTNLGHWPHAYILKEDAQISERRRVRSKMLTAQSSTIKTQLIETIFIRDFGIGD